MVAFPRPSASATFFRVRTGTGETNPSAFAPRQLLLAHAAIADPRLGRLRHDLLNGLAGFSAKAPDPRHASYYYSRPQLKVSGRVTLEGRPQAVTGLA